MITFDSIYFGGKSLFENDGTQNYLVFLPTHRYFKRVSSANNRILSWRSKGFSDEIIKSPSISDHCFNPLLNYVGTKIRIEFKDNKIQFHLIMEK